MADNKPTVACYVDKKYYPHLLLLPAMMIMITLAFLKKRVSFRRDVLGGRPGLVIPMDFLGVDHDRLTITAVFGAATGTILQLVLTQAISDDPWASAFAAIGLGLEAAILYYPLFSCLTTTYKIFGAITGFLYGLIWFIVGTFSTFDKCRFPDAKTESYVIVFIAQIPIIFCNLFILGKFLLVFYKKVQRRISSLPGNLLEQEGHDRWDFQYSKPWFEQYVRNILKPRDVRIEGKVNYYLRMIYNPNENYRFSTQTLSVVVICSILVYYFSVKLLGVFVIIFPHVEDGSLKKILVRAQASGIIAVILATLFCSFSILRFMECHKNNMLRMFQGDKSFIPRLYTKPQYMVGQSLKYACYQFGYLIWGYILLVLIFSLVAFFFSLLTLSDFRGVAAFGGKYLLPFGFVAILSWILLPVLSATVFRDDSFSKDVIALNNRNVYLVFSYFWFFAGLPMGFFSALSRILKSLIIGTVLLARIDTSVLPSGFEMFDSGHRAYLCYLQVHAAFRNPIMRVFCQTLHDANKKSRLEMCPPKRTRTKWLVLLTLINNPQLSSQRKHVIANASLGATGCKSEYGSMEHFDNTAFSDLGQIQAQSS